MVHFSLPNFKKYIGLVKSAISQLSSEFEIGRTFLKDYQVTHITQDREKGYWISTLSAGVFYTSNFNIQSQHLNTEIKRFIPYQNDYYAVDVYKNLFKYEKNLGFVLTTNFPDTVAIMRDSSSLFPIDDTTVVYVSNSNVDVRPPYNWKKRFNYRTPYKRRYSKILRHKSKVTVPTLKGVYTFDLDHIDQPPVFWHTQYPELEQRINELFIENDSNIWIATNTNGIYCIRNGELIHLNQLHPSIGVICRNIVCSEKYVWAACENGLIKIDKSNFEVLQIIRKEDGLLTNKINYLEQLDSILLVAHSSGVSYVPLDFKRKTYPPLIHIQNIKINRQSVALAKDYELENNTGSIQINYSGISYNSDITYHYRMKNGADTNWTITNKRSVEFLSFSPGMHTFELYAVNHHGLKSESPIIITFHIPPPFWLKPWFILLSVLFIVGIVYLSIRFKTQREQKKIAAERKLLEVEQQALRARMNPHFIFNALNSVQLYIMENDKRKSNKYLTSFSRLIRSIVDNSDKKLIPIDIELNILEAYLKTEVIRFKEKVSYTIKIDPNIDTYFTMIPPFLTTTLC